MQRLNEKEFRNKVTVISFVLSLLIVSFHAHNLTVYLINANDGALEKIIVNLQDFIHNIEEIGVPFFFMISGYLFFRKFELKNTMLKWKNRFWSVFVPYVVWGFLYWLYYYILKNLPGIGQLMNMDDISLSLYSIATVVFAHNHTVFWYLQTLLLYILLAPLLYICLKDYRKSFSGLVVLGIIICISSGMTPIDIFSWGGGFFPKRLWTISYFSTGAYVAINHREFVLYKSKLLTILGCVGSLICSILIQFSYGRGLLLCVFCVSVWLATNIFSFNFEIKWWMKISFFIYCIHSAILEAVEKVILVIGGKSVVWCLLDYIIAPIITVVIIFAVAKILQRFPKVWQLLNGGRGI